MAKKNEDLKDLPDDDRVFASSGYGRPDAKVHDEDAPDAAQVNKEAREGSDLHDGARTEADVDYNIEQDDDAWK